MTEQLLGAVTVDVDTLASIYKGYGCRRAGGYTFAELQIGLENLSRFLGSYGIKATLFMVGNDFLQPKNHDPIRAIAGEGHEIANHTMTHAQGFRLMTPPEKEHEIASMEEVCIEIVGQRPVGFRSPGWNIGDDALPILQRRNYLYDSSVFPTSLMPLLKLLHWHTMRKRRGAERTTMGHMKYILAPTVPYTSSRTSLGRRGRSDIIEFPITVDPIGRLPFFATFLLATGLKVFRASYGALKALRRPIQFQFHLSDFVDYGDPVLSDQVPAAGSGVYVPQSLRVSLQAKLDVFKQAMDILTQDYTFITLAEWATQIYN